MMQLPQNLGVPQEGRWLFQDKLVDPNGESIQQRGGIATSQGMREKAGTRDMNSRFGVTRDDIIGLDEQSQPVLD